MLAFTTFRNSNDEAILDRYETVEVLSYGPARGFVEIMDSAGAVRWVSPLRLNAITDGSIADAVIERATVRHRKYLRSLTEGRASG